MSNITREFLRSKFNLAMGLVAIVLFFELGAKQFEVADQEKFGKIINISGKQRMLSQRLILLAGKFQRSQSQLDFDNFKRARDEFESAHIKLSGQDPKFETLSKSEIDGIYFTSNPSVDTLFYQYLKLLKAIELDTKKSDVESIILNLVNLESELLYSLNEVVYKFEAYSKKGVESIKWLEYALFLIILLILFIQNKMLIKPLIDLVMGNIEQLEHNEKQLKIKNREVEETSRAKDDFVSNLSHEIRTPLNGILGMTYEIDAQVGDKKVINILEMIRACTETVTQLFQDAIDLDILKRGKMVLIKKPFCLQDNLNMLVGVYRREAEAKGLNLKLRYDDKIPKFLLGDKERLSQILIYLISNGIKFTEKGHVEVKVSCNEKTDYIDFSVSDTGIGMESNALDKLQEAYHQGDNSLTREHGGLGVGLSIVSRLIELHGGELRISSEMGKGSEFKFSIQMKATDYNLKTIGKIDNPDKIKVLVVEDIELNQRLTKTYLKKMNLTCDIVGNGVEALEALEVKEYDLVFMDIQMPVMDGVTATKRIFEIYGDKRPKVIALTANALENDIKLYKEIGMDGVIAKPINIHTFQDVILSVLNGSSLEKYYSS